MKTFLYCLAAVLAGAGTAWAAEAAKAEAESPLARLDFRQVISGAKDKVFPAVVYIKCLQETHESGQKISQEVAGSGVIISPQGEVLTNWHVIDKAVEVRCLLLDGRALDAKIVGSDKDVDLALLQLAVPAGASVPYAVLGDSETLKEGDFVMAMGAPWGLSRSVSMGIISCAKRFLPGASQYSLWLQTDAAISPGNSGGPLVNTAGEVVGVNARGAMSGGDMGFAVPAGIIRDIVAQLRQYGKMNWSWTGLQLQALKDFDRNIYFEGTEGVIVAETDPESPARRAGLQARDRLLRIGGRPITALTAEDLPAVRRFIGLLPKHQKVTIDFLRGDKPMTVELEPREKGKVEGAELDCPRWDLTVREINQFDNPDLFFYRDKGVFIYGVKAPGNAGAAGLRPQDVVVKIDGKDVAALDDVRAIHKQSLEGLKTKTRAIFSVLRNGLVRQVVLDYSRDYSKE
jgi:S1-C subfamily serine protease